MVFKVSVEPAAVPPMRSGVVALVVKVGVVSVGELENTKFPAVPVVPETDDSRFAAVMVETRFFEPSVATRREAVRPPKFTVPVAVRPLKVAVPEKAGLFEKTARPVPVSSERSAASPAEFENAVERPRLEVAIHCVPVPVDLRM